MWWQPLVTRCPPGLVSRFEPGSAPAESPSSHWWGSSSGLARWPSTWGRIVVYTYFKSRAVRPRGRVLAYEPQPDLAAYVQVGMARAHNVTVRQVALGDRLGTAELTIPSRDGRPEPG